MKVKAHMSMSVDGFIAGPDASQENPLGTNGLKLHDWMVDNPNVKNWVSMSTEGPAAFTFVTDGIESALEQAKAVAGDKDVWIGGGANAIQQYIKAGLLDELKLHVVPLLLGSGTSMFGELGTFIELKKVEVVDEPGVTHFTYRFRK